MQMSSRWEMNRIGNMYLNKLLLTLQTICSKKLQKYEGGQGLFRDNDQNSALEQEVILDLSLGEMTCVHEDFCFNFLDKR